MNLDYLATALFICGIICLLFTMILMVYIGIKIGYGFELTPEQIADEQKTQFCIVYNISNEECFLVYGDTQSNWEPKKK